LQSLSPRMQTTDVAPAPLERKKGGAPPRRRGRSHVERHCCRPGGRGSRQSSLRFRYQREGEGVSGAPRIVPLFRRTELLPPSHQLATNPATAAARSSRSRGGGDGRVEWRLGEEGSCRNVAPVRTNTIVEEDPRRRGPEL
jgi:hypothetical protein